MRFLRFRRLGEPSDQEKIGDITNKSPGRTGVVLAKYEMKGSVVHLRCYELPSGSA